ncbi:molybdopterin-dependent oxidoreductase [Devosia psychrophila]|uniref:Molybdopterin oxidoreductase n=1 Tax=Devosia psychrophila TaxID=728005 RepID=A0A0F5PUW7_9HYPH|nr:molybdopterin-dependent oxidoreductase [Devosia psychrophila]KKC32181.1 molybdopterin oxidoreductase [Devosia psychrophila]SFC34469.1 Oxidoreductase molybdopterin binding domain-containing protein [Devosia psychrophila]
MSRLITRRNFLRTSAVSGSGLILAGCDQFDFLADKSGPARQIMERANVLTYSVQRAVIGEQTLAREYAASEIRQGMRPNGSVDPTTPEYLALKEANFAGYKLTIKGLVDREVSFSLAELRNMPERTQITRHDCVEGWSCIAKWTGTPLGPLLDMAGVKSTARYCVYHCFDNIQRTLSGDILYYTSSDLIDAYHPQSILSYGLNDEVLPVSNGAPIRLRIERALGYKQPKYLHTIELVDDLTPFGKGRGGYWEDTGYDWYGGI